MLFCRYCWLQGAGSPLQSLLLFDNPSGYRRTTSTKSLPAGDYNLTLPDGVCLAAFSLSSKMNLKICLPLSDWEKLKMFKFFSPWLMSTQWKTSLWDSCRRLSPMIVSLLCFWMLCFLIYLDFSLERELWRNQNNRTLGRAELQSRGLSELTK